MIVLAATSITLQKKKKLTLFATLEAHKPNTCRAMQLSSANVAFPFPLSLQPPMAANPGQTWLPTWETVGDVRRSNLISGLAITLTSSFNGLAFKFTHCRDSMEASFSTGTSVGRRNITSNAIHLPMFLSKVRNRLMLLTIRVYIQYIQNINMKCIWGM